ncbi:MAG TPA: UDP-N-acetylglucosamine 2-epimerase (non-hydrolyzing) [Thermoplasmata archaeon]|nr:UDP-N-acetylglucosamine 2-epimerase (non-hydrolyzing) [Thermoplasmata archaeon]
MKIICVAGARPNFMKIAPIYEEMVKYEEFNPIILHTGQHYDRNMSQVFFEELGIPKPDISLGVGSGTHAKQTATIMMKFEDVVTEEWPDLVVVVGDVNSTLACSLVSTKLHIPVAHVEAGLRSHNWMMPEEINRVLTDRISDYLFTPSRDADENLLNEGIEISKIHFVGNVMIDTLLKHREMAKNSEILSQLGLEYKEYAVLTLHRAENVDDRANLMQILRALEKIQKEIKIIYPIHPRTRLRIKEFGLQPIVDSLENLLLTEPLGYLDFIYLMDNARFVMTDSGGIQEETTILGVPCLTLRTETERPITVKEGTNIVVGLDWDRIVEEAKKILAGMTKEGRIPEKWDGKAAKRIVDVLREGKEK